MSAALFFFFLIASPAGPSSALVHKSTFRFAPSFFVKEDKFFNFL